MLGLFKLLPIFQLLFDIFKPGDGEQVTRGAKISALAIVALLLYSGFVSYAYVEQYHVVVKTTTQNAYQETVLAEKKGELTTAKKEAIDYREKYFACLEDGSYKQPDVPKRVADTPPVPVHATQPKAAKSPPKEPVGVASGTGFRQELLKKINED